MIQLHTDCLVFETSDGEAIPCSAQDVTVELRGDAAHTAYWGTLRAATRRSGSWGVQVVKIISFIELLLKYCPQGGYSRLPKTSEKKH